MDEGGADEIPEADEAWFKGAKLVIPRGGGSAPKPAGDIKRGTNDRRTRTPINDEGWRMSAELPPARPAHVPESDQTRMEEW